MLILLDFVKVLNSFFLLFRKWISIDFGDDFSLWDVLLSALVNNERKQRERDLNNHKSGIDITRVNGNSIKGLNVTKFAVLLLFVRLFVVPDSHVFVEAGEVLLVDVVVSVL